MGDNVIKFPERLKGNGAREALDAAFGDEGVMCWENGDEQKGLPLQDRVLGRLWLAGFKVVPVEAEGLPAGGEQGFGVIAEGTEPSSNPQAKPERTT